MVPTRSTDGPIALESITEHLVEAGTAFIAIPMHPLNNGYICLLTYAPGNNELTDYARELETINQVMVDEGTFEFRGISNVIHPEVHFESRVPLYAVSNSMYGLSAISLDEGLTNLRNFLRGNYDTKSSEEIVPLKALVEELIEGGAVAVGLQKTLFERDDTSLPLRVHIPPVIGRNIAGQYKAVSVGDETYTPEIEAVIDGPGFHWQVPIYAADSILGMDPVSVDIGIQNLQTYLADNS